MTLYYATFDSTIQTAAGNSDWGPRHQATWITDGLPLQAVPGGRENKPQPRGLRGVQRKNPPPQPANNQKALGAARHAPAAPFAAAMLEYGWGGEPIVC